MRTVAHLTPFSFCELENQGQATSFLEKEVEVLLAVCLECV